MLLPLDSPAVRRWLEDWDPDLHPRGVHGRFGSGGAARAMRLELAVAAARYDRRINVSRSVRDRRSPRHLGHTEEMWQTSYSAHGHRGESLDEYKRRATAAALARGMTRDGLGFFYSASDTKQQRPLAASGFAVGVLPPRRELHRMERPNSDRAEAQRVAGMKPRRQKYRRSRTGVLEKVGFRTVGTHTGQRRATKVKTAHEALFGYSPALARFFEAETSVAGVKGAAKLHEYWTAGKGLAKWADSPEPWTTLRDHLLKFMDPDKATRTATVWFHDVFGFYPGSDLNRVTHGKPPRGKVVGPG